MSSFTGKSLKNFYKDILHTNNSNTGISSSIKQITCGDGDSTTLYLSDRNLKILPSVDNTASAVIYDKDGNVLFKVDSTNDLVKAGIGQHVVNTQYAHFCIGSGDSVWAGASAGTHYAVPFNSIATQALVSGGTSADPATSFTISTTADDMVGVLWYVMDNITIDRIVWWHGNDDVGANAVRTHLMQYTIDSGNSSTGGDLSSGAVLAYSSDVTNAGYEQSYYNQMTISTANVDAGKAILFFVRSDTAAEDLTINATIKYHLR
tara:strand:+ start:957 stop:1745 length:789 start_codon:yes stop_codon:yes gene_type:complete